MSQTSLIVICALAAGVAGAWGTWLFIDAGALFGDWFSRRRERERLEREAAAVKRAEEKDEG